MIEYLHTKYYKVAFFLSLQYQSYRVRILFGNLCEEIVRKEKRENKFQVEISLTDKTFRSICV